MWDAVFRRTMKHLSFAAMRLVPWFPLALSAGLCACSPADQVIGASEHTQIFDPKATKSVPNKVNTPPAEDEPDPIAATAKPSDGGAAASIGSPSGTDPVGGASGNPGAGTPKPSTDAGGRSPDGGTLLPSDGGVDPIAVLGPNCKVTFDVTTVSSGGDYSPRNVGAIWITDTSKKFVKSLRVWGQAQRGRLGKWNTSSKGNTTDAITGATASSHGARNGTWNCTGTNKLLVAPGNYFINAEITESNSNGPSMSAPFTLGPDPVTAKPTGGGSFTGASLKVTP